MGQSIASHFEGLKSDVVKEAHTLKEIIDITHEEVLAKLKEVNEICKHSRSECESRFLKFRVKRGSDTTFLWKQTIRIVCIRVSISDDTAELFCSETIDEESLNNMLATLERDVEDYKLLSLRQFLIAYKMILYHFNCIQAVGLPSPAEKDEYMTVKNISPSMILEQIMNESQAESEECIICMERKPEVTLPCAHAYCLFCIEQWNVSNKTCPVCRATMENTDDSWVTPEIPEKSEVDAEIKKALTVLTLKLPEN